MSAKAVRERITGSILRQFRAPQRNVMNLLLQLIGRTLREGIPTGPRADQKQFLLRYAVQSAIKGQFAAAASLFALTTQDSTPSLTETLTVATLHLAASNDAAAIKLFDHAVSPLIAEGSPLADSPATHRFQQEPQFQSPVPSLETSIDEADKNLCEGRYLRASGLFQNIRNTLDLLLSAHTGKAIAEANTDIILSTQSLKALIPLAKLDDLLLRMLARTHLAGNVAAGLRQRDLRDDLAPWATSNQNVDTLLESEFNSLKSISRANPAHAENNYRLALVARTIGRFDEADLAFQRVLRIHPHHLSSATRLAATLLQLQRPDRIIECLTSAILIPPQTLARYHALGSVAEEQQSDSLYNENNSPFDRALDSLRENLADRQSQSVTRANLAFALAEMGLLNAERSAWREAAAMAPTPFV